MESKSKKTVSMRLDEAIIAHYQTVADKSDRSLGYVLAKVVESDYNKELEKPSVQQFFKPS
ncbi:MAG: hypothetical protein V4714_17745 [Bacteroidota bacterium]